VNAARLKPRSNGIECAHAPIRLLGLKPARLLDHRDVTVAVATPRRKGFVDRDHSPEQGRAHRDARVARELRADGHIQWEDTLQSGPSYDHGRGRIEKVDVVLRVSGGFRVGDVKTFIAIMPDGCASFVDQRAGRLSHRNITLLADRLHHLFDFSRVKDVIAIEEEKEIPTRFEKRLIDGIRLARATGTIVVVDTLDQDDPIAVAAQNGQAPVDAAIIVNHNLVSRTCLVERRLDASAQVAFVVVVVDEYGSGKGHIGQARPGYRRAGEASGSNNYERPLRISQGDFMQAVLVAGKVQLTRLGTGDFVGSL